MSNVDAGIKEKPEETGSEAQALAEILIWSKDCPKWQSDALRRLCTQGELDENDLDELTTLCKDNGGVPLVAEHIPDPKAVTMTVSLKGIHSIENVNALKEGERLSFN